MQCCFVWSNIFFKNHCYIWKSTNKVFPIRYFFTHTMLLMDHGAEWRKKRKKRKKHWPSMQMCTSDAIVNFLSFFYLMNLILSIFLFVCLFVFVFVVVWIRVTFNYIYYNLERNILWIIIKKRKVKERQWTMKATWLNIMTEEIEFF